MKKPRLTLRRFRFRVQSESLGLVIETKSLPVALDIATETSREFQEPVLVEDCLSKRGAVFRRVVTPGGEVSVMELKPRKTVRKRPTFTPLF